MLKKLLWAASALLLLGCSAEQPDVERLGSAAECNPLGQVCRVARGDSSVGLQLPSGVRPLSRFPVTVYLEGVSAREVTIEFTMQGMDMGVNRFGLRKTQDAWTGEAILPVCTTGRLDWVATVEAVTDDNTLSAEFRFATSP